jgi:hypothetical protein
VAHESEMIRTQTGTQNRPEMVAVHGTLCKIPLNNSSQLQDLYFYSLLIYLTTILISKIMPTQEQNETMISEVERIWKEIVKYYTGSHVE